MTHTLLDAFTQQTYSQYFWYWKTK